MADRLFCLEAGSPLMPTVVLLHGFGGCAEVWAGLIASIQYRAHVLAFDLPGHGGSLHYPNFGSPRIAASAVAGELSQRGIDRFHIVGHSMGGAVAVLLALEGQGKVASLTLLAPGGFGPEINADIMRQIASASSVAEVQASFEMMCGRVKDGVQPVFSCAAASRLKTTQRDALGLILSKIMRDGTQGQLPFSQLAALNIPLKLLWGEQDPVVPVSQACAAPQVFDKTILPAVGHMLIEEAPETVLRAILAQLD
jgi:pimeloyl-ACP methyl ester carboxylesterase